MRLINYNLIIFSLTSLIILLCIPYLLAEPSNINTERSEDVIIKGKNTNEMEAKVFLERYNREYGLLLNQLSVAEWDYNGDLSNTSKAAKAREAQTKFDAYSNTAYAQASTFNTTSFSYDTKRLLSKVGSPSLSQAEMNELNHVLSEMKRIYGSQQVMRDGKGYPFEPDLKTIMEKSINASERLWAWQGWHENVGRAMRPHYIKFVEMQNRLARLKNYEDSGDQMRQEYETKELEPIVLELYRELEPLYKQLHAYIRRRLYQTYGPKEIDLKGPLPAHLLGDMWGRFWSGLSDIVQPYPGKTSVDPTPAMIKQNYTVRRMFELGDDFFQSMGLKPLPETFYKLSLIEKPKDPNRKLICHPSAWDFYDGKDFRVKMCTRRIFEDFLTLHHELGHIQYYMQYAHHPIPYRDSANGGFHEAIGELMGMSVATTKHLRVIGLLESDENDPDVEINFLMKQSLRTVMSLPLHLVLDTWRWKIFKGKVPVQQWNREFWNQRRKVAGVTPPVLRDDGLDLDPTALIHVPYHVPMMYYFTRTILQYQFSEALCRAAGHSGPLHRCDIYNSTEAGTALAKMMQMGSSRPWPDALEALTGYREMSTKPLLNYFRPLHQWLERENKRNREVIGWSKNSKAHHNSGATDADSYTNTKLMVIIGILKISFQMVYG